MIAELMKVSPRSRKNMGEVDSLMESICDVGLIHPLVVERDGNLIAGERRLSACLQLGMRDIPVTIVDLDEDQRLRVEDDENAVRKDFTPTEACAIREARLEREKEKAKERMSEGRKMGKVTTPCGKVRDKAAAGTGYSGWTLDKVKLVEEAAAVDLALAPVVEETDRTGKVDPAYRVVVPRLEELTEEQRDAWQKAQRKTEKERSRCSRAVRSTGICYWWLEQEDANREVRDTLADLLEKHGDLRLWGLKYFDVFPRIETALRMLADVLEERRHGE